MNTNTYTAENLLTAHHKDEAYSFMRRGIGAVQTFSLVGKKVLLRNWDSSLDWVYIVCIHIGEVIGEEVVTVLYDTDNQVQTMDLAFLTNSIEEIYEPDRLGIKSIW